MTTSKSFSLYLFLALWLSCSKSENRPMVANPALASTLASTVAQKVSCEDAKDKLWKLAETKHVALARALASAGSASRAYVKSAPNDFGETGKFDEKKFLAQLQKKMRDPRWEEKSKARLKTWEREADRLHEEEVSKGQALANALLGELTDDEKSGCQPNELGLVGLVEVIRWQEPAAIGKSAATK